MEHTPISQHGHMNHTPIHHDDPRFAYRKATKGAPGGGFLQGEGGVLWSMTPPSTTSKQAQHSPPEAFRGG